MPRPKKAQLSQEEAAQVPLTFRERKFVDAMFKTEPPFNGAEAARVAGYSKAGAAVQAVRMLIKANVEAEIKKRRAAIEAQFDITRDRWVRRGLQFFHGNVKKMFDEHNNVIDIPLLGDNEAALIAGFEIVEDFTKVKKANGTEDAVPTGYTKKFKLVDPLKAQEYVGKMMGYIDDDPPESDKSLKSIQIVFVNAAGTNVQVNLAKPPAVVQPHTKNMAGVKFVR